MRYTFNEFEFNTKSLVLTQKGQDLAIRHNEAKVLKLLLEHNDKVLSKEEILSQVWQDKVVSEQAVFQNISHLRSLFGNEAIKTFSKRGYQWQLPTEELTETLSITETVSDTLALQANIQPKKRILWPYAMFFSIIIVLISAFYLQTTSVQKNESSAIKLAYVPMTLEQENINLDDNANFDFTALEHLNTTQFNTSAEIEYPNLAQQHPFVLTAELREYQQNIYLDFIVKGPFADWQGQLFAASKNEAIKQLQKHLAQDFIYQTLDKALTPELKLANLSIAHQQQPDDLIILGQLIQTYIDMAELDKAMIMAEKLANIAQAQNNYQQLGNAYLFQSTVLTRKELFDLSTKKLTLAIAEFEKIDDLKRLADAWNAQSWLDHQNNDYPAIKNSLLTSAKLAYQAKDIPRELHALTYLSVLAHKHHQEDDKYLYLNQAENKMRAYELPIYRFAKIPFHYAIYTPKPSDKEPHLKQVLEFTELTPNHWIAQSSRKQLMKHYLTNNRYQDAQALISNLSTDNAENSYLKTLLAQATAQPEDFISQAQLNFEQAQLAGDKRLSLDIALLLCSTPNAQVNYDFYSQYINDNANKYWRRDNKSKLLALNL